MDADPRDDRLADERFRDDRPGPPSKLARTDTFPLRMQIHNNEILGSLVRSNSSMVPDCRISSTTSDGLALLGSDNCNYMADARMVLPGVAFSGNASRGFVYHQQQALPFKSAAALMSAYGGGGVHEAERLGSEGIVQQVQVFTANQLRELQLHALIFKHMMCGVNVPPELVLLVRTSVAALAGMTTGASHLGSLGWGNYHLGYGNSVDPEPGRCRRTDGKKWRCARDVVPDQKYCERHMHRGRHRNRKPPEPSSSPAPISPSSSTVSLASAARSSAGTATPPTPSSASFLPSSASLSFQSASSSPNLPVKTFSSTSSPSTGALSISSSVHTNHLQQQLALQAAGVKDFRYLNNDIGQEQTLFSDARGLSQESPALSGLSVISSAVNNRLGAMHSRAQQHSFLGSGYEGGGGGREPEGQPLRHFFDDWPRGRDPPALTWPEMEGERSNRSSSTTQLSISIPNMQTGGGDFAANGSSPRGGKLALSPLKLSMSRGEEDPLGVEAATQMGLGVGLGVNESERQRLQLQSSWIPVAWESSSVGGPLAEVLHSSSNTPRGGGPASHNAGNRSGGLNLMTDAWEHSPRSSPPTSSPTGVLQINATFGSFSSDNSTASSPRSAALNKQPHEPNI